MSTFKQGDVIRVPFPYTDRTKRQHRPAVVVSDGPVGDQRDLLLVAMVTSARNRSWPGDCMMEAYSQAGLPKPSMVRPCKITTIEARDAERLGQVPDALTAQVVSAVIRLLGR